MTEDLLVKPSDGCKLRQDLDGIKFQSSRVWEMGLERKSHMKGVEIPVQPVQRSLCTRRLFLDDGIRLTLGGLIHSRSGSSICLPPKGDPRNVKELSNQLRKHLAQHSRSSLAYLYLHVGHRTPRIPE